MEPGLQTVQATPLQRHAIGSLVKRIARTPSVRRIILFGSRARGDAGEWSDVDIAIDAPEATHAQWVEMLNAAEDAETLLIIQLVRLDETSGAFRTAVESEGIVLYERHEH